MTEMQGIETPETPTPQPTARQRLIGGYRKFRKQAEIRGLQVAEKYLRVRNLRLSLIELLGALIVFHGIEGYSHRVAFIILGAGVIFAIERQPSS